MTLKDIQSREDIELFIKRFYERLLNDPLMSPKFDHIDLENHLPVLIDFWESVLLYKPVYHGSPFEVHVPLNLEKEHFKKWLYHFNDNLDQLFEGVKVENAKTRANAVAKIFMSKLKL